MPERSSGISSVGSALSFKPESSVPEVSACNETAVRLDLDSKSTESCNSLRSSTVASVPDAGEPPVIRPGVDDFGPCVGVTGRVSKDCGTLERSDGLEASVGFVPRNDSNESGLVASARKTKCTDVGCNLWPSRASQKLGGDGSFLHRWRL